MNSDARIRRRETLSSITHYITAFVVLMKGIDKIGTPGKTGYGVLFIAISLMIAAGTIFHHRFEKMLHHFKAYVFILEALVLALVGYLYMKEGKAVQFAYFFSSAMFIVALVVYVVRKRSGKGIAGSQH